MNLLWTILLFAGCLADALVCAGISIVGLRRGRIGYEPSCAPLEFASRPVRFVLLVALYIGLAALLSIGVLQFGLSLWRML